MQQQRLLAGKSNRTMGNTLVGGSAESTVVWEGWLPHF